MNFLQIRLVYFSATGTTEKVVTRFADRLSSLLNVGVVTNDFTLPTERQEVISFDEDELIIFGVPVYAGRVPNVLVKFLATMQANNSIAIPVVVYGNRNYDDALIESADILKNAGAKVVAAAAFVGEHSFSNILAAGRPDEMDLHKVDIFVEMIYEKLKSDNFSTPQISGEPYPYRKHFQPKSGGGESFDMRKVKPKTSMICISCGLCANVCPMGSISKVDYSVIEGICIKCGACIKKCPQGAKYFDDENYLFHKRDLEEKYQRRAEPEFFI